MVINCLKIWSLKVGDLMIQWLNKAGSIVLFLAGVQQFKFGALKK